MQSGWGKSGLQPHSPDWSDLIPPAEIQTPFGRRMIMIATIESQYNESPVHFNIAAILLDPRRKSVRVEEFE